MIVFSDKTCESALCAGILAFSSPEITSALGKVNASRLKCRVSDGDGSVCIPGGRNDGRCTSAIEESTLGFWIRSENFEFEGDAVVLAGKAGPSAGYENDL